MLCLQVMSAGSGGCIHHWSLNGTSKSHIPSSVGTVYSVAINSKSVKANVGRFLHLGGVIPY